MGRCDKDEDGSDGSFEEDYLSEKVVPKVKESQFCEASKGAGTQSGQLKKFLEIPRSTIIGCG